jgi:hypothetical protein
MLGFIDTGRMGVQNWAADLSRDLRGGVKMDLIHTGHGSAVIKN